MAWALNSCTKSYEAEVYSSLFFWVVLCFRYRCIELMFAMFSCKVAQYKSQIFSNLKEKKANKILEIGIGTGPNLSYYTSNSDVQVVGIDPNPEMEKYARSAAVSAGLPLSNFEFIHAVCNV